MANEPTEKSTPPATTDGNGDEKSSVIHDSSSLPDVDPDSFLAQVPEQYRNEPSLQKYKTQQELLDQYLYLERYRGSSIKVPGEDATDEERNEFNQKLMKHAPNLAARQLPEDADSYQVPEGIDDDGGAEIKAFKKLAHESGLSNEQFQNMVKQLGSQSAEQAEQAQREYAQAVKALKDEWGDAYGDRYNAAARLAKSAGFDYESFENGTAHPMTVQAYYKLATMMGSEGSEMANEPSTEPTRLTPLEIQDEIDKVTKQLTDKEMNASNPKYKQLLERKRELFRMLPANRKPINVGYQGGGIGGVQIK